MAATAVASNPVWANPVCASVEPPLTAAPDAVVDAVPAHVPMAAPVAGALAVPDPVGVGVPVAGALAVPVAEGVGVPVAVGVGAGPVGEGLGTAAAMTLTLRVADAVLPAASETLYCSS